MSWRDSLGKVEFEAADGTRPKLIGATFRGVPFFVEVAERAGGRRNVVHEYPLRDVPSVEDLGRRARTYPVEGYVLGDRYVAQRDALLEALEEEGPGELAHPYYGTLRVALAGPFRVRESVADGGMARFSVEFVEAPSTQIDLEPAPDATALVAASATAAVAAIRLEAEAVHDTDGLAESLVESGAELITSATEAMEEILGPALETEQALADLKRDLDAIALDAAALARRPGELVDALQEVLLGLVTPVLPPEVAVPALLAAYEFTASVERPPATTSNREREQTNYDALDRAIRRLMAVQAARLAPTVTFDSYEAAVESREAVAAALEEQILVAGDESYAELVQLRADLVKSVPGADSELARLVSYTPPATIPSLVLAHQLYGDLDMEQDLLTRNRVGRPGFVLGGRPLEVLSRG